MDKKSIEKKHYNLTFRINRLLLGTHICLLALFLSLKVTLMVYVNIGSILLYLTLFFFYKKSIVRYIAIVLVEVLIHMSLATISVGWDAGFQFYSFCLIPCIFLCDYLAKTDHMKPMHPIAVSAIVVVCFLLCRWYCVSHTAIYVLERNIAYTLLFSYNILVSFAFLIIYVTLFERRILSKERLLENKAEIDELTQLPNRYLMQGWLTEGYEMAKNNTPLAIAMIDVDDFKKLNDKYGHNCGDMVLIQIASKIRQHIDDSVHVARWGGEEFLFLATGTDAFMLLHQHLEDLQQDIAASPLTFENQQIAVTITAGITIYKEQDSTVFDTIKRADDCMYQGKLEGKNKVISSR